MSNIIANRLAVVNAITTQAIASTVAVSSSWLDVSNYEGHVLIVVNSAAASASDTLDITVSENTSTSGSGSAVPADALFNPSTGVADTFDQITDAGASFQVMGLKLERVSQYIRVTATAAGSGISIPMGACIIGTKKYVS